MVITTQRKQTLNNIGSAFQFMARLTNGVYGKHVDRHHNTWTTQRNETVRFFVYDKWMRELRFDTRLYIVYKIPHKDRVITFLQE